MYQNYSLFLVGMTGYSTVAKIHTLCALKASFQIFERRMRTCIRFANKLESTNQTKKEDHHKDGLLFGRNDRVCFTTLRRYRKRYANLHPLREQARIDTPSKKEKTTTRAIFSFLVRVFITDLILRHSAEVVETYSPSAENACVYKEFCNTKGI